MVCHFSFILTGKCYIFTVKVALKSFSCFNFQPLIAAGAIAAGTVGFGYTLYQSSVSAEDYNLHPPKFDWSHNGMMSSLDHSRYKLFEYILQAIYV